MGPTQQEGFEKLICGRMIILVQGFHELVQSAVSLGPSVAAIFKSLTKLYLTFLGLIKYVSLQPFYSSSISESSVLY